MAAISLKKACPADKAAILWKQEKISFLNCTTALFKSRHALEQPTVLQKRVNIIDNSLHLTYNEREQDFKLSEIRNYL